MKVYVLEETRGSYDQHHDVLGIFTTREKAEEHEKKHMEINGWGNYWTKEYDLDPTTIVKD